MEISRAGARLVVDVSGRWYILKRRCSLCSRLCEENDNLLKATSEIRTFERSFLSLSSI